MSEAVGLLTSIPVPSTTRNKSSVGWQLIRQCWPSVLPVLGSLLLAYILDARFTFNHNLAKDMLIALASGFFLMVSLSPVAYAHCNEALAQQEVHIAKCIGEIRVQEGLLVHSPVPRERLEFWPDRLEIEAGLKKRRDESASLRKRLLKDYRMFLVSILTLLALCLSSLAMIDLMEGFWAFYQLAFYSTMTIYGIYFSATDFMGVRETADSMNSIFMEMRAVLISCTEEVRQFVESSRTQLVVEEKREQAQ